MPGVSICIFLIGALLSVPAGVAFGQPGPVAAMYGDDQKRGATISSSFATSELPPTTSAAFPARIYLTAGDLERAFDVARFRPDGAIVPTNTELLVTAPWPATQQVLTERVGAQAAVMRDLEDQIAARRRKSASTAAPGTSVLDIGVDSFLVQLPRQPDSGQPGAFPRFVCLIATDLAQGGAIDRRELFTQDRVRKGITACLSALDASGVRSVVLPLMGAASSGTQARDADYEGQRALKECRLLNSLAGIAQGIHDFAASRRHIREIGIIQWDQELSDMFDLARGNRVGQIAYRAYSDQVKLALRKGLSGQTTTPSDVAGSCGAIFNPR
jgi:hypothetical protein